MRLLGEGALSGAINITVYSATASALKAVQDAGGSVTTTKKAPPAEGTSA